MKGLFKKVFLTAAALLGAIVLSGCGAGITYSASTDGTYDYYNLTVSAPLSLLSTIERTATLNSETLTKWTFSDYVFGLSQRLIYEDGSRFNQIWEGNTDGSHVINLQRKTLSSSRPDGEPDENYGEERDNLFFFYRNTVTVSNPFNGLRAEYDEAQFAHTDLMSIIKFGMKSYGPAGIIISYYPSVYEAFPALEGADVSGFKLSYLMTAPRSGSSSGETVEIEGNRYFRFERLFDAQQLTLSYRYYTPNPLGWYFSAIFFGALTVAVILLSTKKRRKKNKPRPAELFPYDPFDQSSGSENLPAGYNRGGEGEGGDDEPRGPGGFRY